MQHLLLSDAFCICGVMQHIGRRVASLHKYTEGSDASQMCCITTDTKSCLPLRLGTV